MFSNDCVGWLFAVVAVVCSLVALVVIVVAVVVVDTNSFGPP